MKDWLKKLIAIKPKEEFEIIFPVCILALICVLLLGAIPIWWTSIKEFLVYGSDESVANYVVIRNMGLFAAGIIGVVLAGWRAKSMDRQASVAEQGHITDRIIKATENLGSHDMHVRIGAIYTLWRTAQDSNLEHDKTSILNILCAFIRVPTSDDDRTINHDEKLREDVQTALTLVTTKLDALRLLKRYSLDLRNSNLQYADLRGANLNHAQLYKANLSCSNLNGAQLKHSFLTAANLYKSLLVLADLTGAQVVQTVLRSSLLSAANFTQASMFGADLRDAQFYDNTVFHKAFMKKAIIYDDIEYIELFTKEQLDQMNIQPRTIG